MEGENSIQKFKCDLCDGEFTEKWNLQRHQKVSCPKQPSNNDEVINELTYKCDPCNKIFSRKDHLTRHQNLSCPSRKKEMSNKPTFQCVRCSRSFTRKDGLAKHNKKGRCPKANDRLVDGEKDRENESVREASQNETVQEDSQKETVREAPQKDTVEETSEKATDKRESSKPLDSSLHPPASSTGKNRRNSKCKDQRKKTCKPKTVFKCEPCNMTFGKKCNYQRHQKQSCSANEVRSKRECKLCHKLLSNEYSLERHQNSSSCQVRDAAGNIINGLEKKITKKFKCVKCGESFSRKENLKYHKFTDKCKREANKIRAGGTQYGTHNGDMEALIDSEEIEQRIWYHCNPCGKKYTTKSHLIQHQRITKCQISSGNENDDQSQFQSSCICDVCGAIFQWSQALYRHKRRNACMYNLLKIQRELHWVELTTAQERIELICEICKKSFSRKYSLFHHKRNSICKKGLTYDVENQKSNKPSVSQTEISSILPTTDSIQCVDVEAQKQQDAIRESESLDKNSAGNLVLQVLKIQFPCRWCYARISSQAEMVTHMQTRHQKILPKDKLEPEDDMTLKIDMTCPKTICCYICLTKFYCVYTSFLCIKKCERKIDLNMEGYVHPRLR